MRQDQEETPPIVCSSDHRDQAKSVATALQTFRRLPDVGDVVNHIPAMMLDTNDLSHASAPANRPFDDRTSLLRRVTARQLADCPGRRSRRAPAGEDLVIEEAGPRSV